MPRTIVIGDIHGCFDELLELLHQLELKEEDFLLSLGDIVDRGNKSLEVYQFFKSRPNSKVLMGNHERKHLYGILNYAQEIVKVQFGAAYPEFLQWLQNLEYYHETPEAIIVHAAFEPDKDLAAQREDVLCGSTAGERYLEQQFPAETYWSDHYLGNKPIIYGHHVVGDQAKIVNNTYGIDTGACHGGYLTALELPGFIIHQVKVQTDHWKVEQTKWQLPVLQAKNWEEMEYSNIQKMLEKLAYLESAEVKKYLHNIQRWLGLQEVVLDRIFGQLHLLSTKLHNVHRDQFNVVASQFPFYSYLFRARKNELSLQDLQKGFPTAAKRQKLIEILQRELEEIRSSAIAIDSFFNVLNLEDFLAELLELSNFYFDIYQFDNALKYTFGVIKISTNYGLPELELKAQDHLRYMQWKEINDWNVALEAVERCIDLLVKHFPDRQNELEYYQSQREAIAVKQQKGK